MTEFLKSQFHFMLAYRFQSNRPGHVRTAWLDTFDRNFKTKSGSETYTIYKRVAEQYFNYQMKILQSESVANRLKSVINHLLESYTIKPDFTKSFIHSLIYDYLNKYGDSHERYRDNRYEPLIYIRYQVDDFNHFISNLSGVLNLSFTYPQPRPITTLTKYAETKNITPPVIHPWYERTPTLTHKKGYRGFVRDYDYLYHW